MSVCAAAGRDASQSLPKAVWRTSSVPGAESRKRTLTVALQCVLSKDMVSSYLPLGAFRESAPRRWGVDLHGRFTEHESLQTVGPRSTWRGGAFREQQ